MATIRKEIITEITADKVWAAVRDVGALATRLAPGAVTACEMVVGAEPPTRRVTFGDGTVLLERIVSCDDDMMRLVWSIFDASVDHHNGALQVFERGDRALVVWTADVLPDALALPFGGFMEGGLAAMKRHLESSGAD